MERIGGEIDRELARSGSRDAIPLAAITAAWPVAVGAAVARQAWPLRLGRDGTLHVAVASSTWAHELDLLQDAILDGLRARLADATPPAVRFAVGPIPEPPTSIEDAATENDPPISVPPEVESAAAAAASEIDDPELRELVARAARASLVKARSDRDF
jgi:Dna[CI] antecedent DciA-like protein